MTVTTYRAHQIGGCITEISSQTTKILIDFGEELPGSAKSEPLDCKAVLDGVNAVFFTHSHGDHIGMFNQVPTDIPMYIGAVSKEILLLLNKQLAKHNPEKEKLIPIIEQFLTYAVAQKIVVGDISVTPFLTDHSAFDAYMLLIECDGERILHTGDFRTHGFRGKGVLPTLQKYVGQVDALICEGTMLSRDGEELPTEQKLQQKMAKQAKKNTFLLCSSTNFDRIASFYHLREGRAFVCDQYQKDMLRIVAEHSQSKTDFYQFNKVYVPYGTNHLMEDWIEEQGVFALIRNNDFSRRLLEKYYDPQNSVLFYSQWKGYLQPDNPAYDARLDDFLKPYAYEHLHTSGHAAPDAIRAIIEILKPKKVYGIHTENPKWFEGTI